MGRVHRTVVLVIQFITFLSNVSHISIPTNNQARMDISMLFIILSVELTCVHCLVYFNNEPYL
jgi:hypothetical protein